MPACTRFALAVRLTHTLTRKQTEAYTSIHAHNTQVGTLLLEVFVDGGDVRGHKYMHIYPSIPQFSQVPCTHARTHLRRTGALTTNIRKHPFSSPPSPPCTLAHSLIPALSLCQPRPSLRRSPSSQLQSSRIVFLIRTDKSPSIQPLTRQLNSTKIEIGAKGASLLER
jgi:hypothetical protein